MRFYQLFCFCLALVAATDGSEPIIRRLLANQDNDLNDDTSSFVKNEVGVDSIKANKLSLAYEDTIDYLDYFDRENLLNLLIAIRRKLHLNSPSNGRIDRLKRPSWAKTRRLE
jgi:hypothetical protein